MRTRKFYNNPGDSTDNDTSTTSDGSSTDDTGREDTDTVPKKTPE